MIPSLGQVSTWLANRWHVTVPDDWLEACLRWIQEENAGAGQRPDSIKQMVYDQWLLGDLRELSSACLPAALNEHKKYELSGHFCLQVDSMVDVSTSFYSQLQKVKGTENANVHVNEATQATQPAWQAKSNRMLMLQLTDGVQDVQAMEYHPIPTLSSDLVPGTKVHIHGSVLCRMGVMMLTRDNITVLGGEVEALLEDNTKDKSIERNLRQNVELGQNPPEMPKREFKEESFTQRGSTMTQPGTQRGSTMTQSGAWPALTAPQQVQPRHQPPQQQYGRNGQQIKSQPVRDDFEEDDFLEQMDVAALDALEQQWDDDEDMDYEAVMEEMDTQMSRQTSPAQPTSQRLTQLQSQGIPSAQAQASTRAPVNRAPVNRGQTTFNQSSHSTKLSQPTFGQSVTPFPNQHQRDVTHGPGFSGTATVASAASCVVNKLSQKNPPVPSRSGPSYQQPKGPTVSIKTEPPLQMSTSRNRPVNQSQNQSGAKADSKSGMLRSTSSRLSLNTSIKQPRLDSFLTKTTTNKAKSRHLVVESSGNVRDDAVVINDFSDEDDMFGDRSESRTVDEASISTADDEFEREVMEMIEDAGFEGGNLPDPSVESRTRPTRPPPPDVGLRQTPWTYLSEVLKTGPPNAQMIFRIKGYFAAILGKLECNEGSHWSLPVQVNDGSASVDADLSDQFLASLIGFTASECMQMRDAAKTDRSLKIKMAQGVKNCQKKIVAMSSILEVEISPNKQRPSILQKIDASPHDLYLLKCQHQAR